MVYREVNLGYRGIENKIFSQYFQIGVGIPIRKKISIHVHRGIMDYLPCETMVDVRYDHTGDDIRTELIIKAEEKLRQVNLV